ncbi:transporter substrate-binding domain-containing protein [Xanthobacter sp. TB0139]|uniref:transporter substrate-binding domain-containing protein n=1 Tax=Xanthobacter sp. TB0139 TaxID=3459178 RepID=UPI0040392445
MTIPNFWNMARRQERPDSARLPRELRFVTADDFPPFNFRDGKGRVIGFNIDLAHAICAELALPCAIQTTPFDAIIPELEEGRADAAMAGIAVTPASRQILDFSERYLGLPARFIARRDDAALHQQATPEYLATRRIGVVSRTAHEAYLRSFFNEAAIRPFPDLASARAALKAGEVDLLFADGPTLALWLNGADSQGCCQFVGGPFTESLFFGEGLAVAVRQGDAPLREAINYALQRIWQKGIYTNLYLRWFPVSFY